MSNVLKTVFLFSALAGLLIAFGWAMGGIWPYVMGVFALVMNLGAWYFSDRIVLRMHNAEEISARDAPRLHAMVADLARSAEIPMPRLYRIPDPAPNAFATGRDPAHGVVAVTDGILRILDERELRGVIAHELAHIKNRDVLVATIGAVMAGVISQLANFVQMSALFGSSDEDEGPGAGGIVLALLAPFVAMLLQFAVSRTREYGADATGAAVSGDPEALASALLKLERATHFVPTQTVTPATASLFIVNPLSAGQRVMRWFSTHPATEERVARLMAMRKAA